MRYYGVMARTVILLTSPVQTQAMLAERVRDARLALGWKQSTLAERAGVSLPTVSRVERSGVTSLENFLKICHAVGGLGSFEAVLKPARARSVAELERQFESPKPKRGRK
jgi:transcriptional regulator with XRE-family HTH domain